MKRRSTLYLLVFGFVLSLLLSACTSKEGNVIVPLDEGLSGDIIIALDRGGREPHVLEPTSRKVYSPMQLKLLEFIELHPNVTINIMPAQRFEHTRDGLVPVDLPVVPDIIELTPHQVRWGMSEGLQDLSFYIENLMDGHDLNGDYATLISLARVDERAYLLPTRSDPMMAYYAAPIFEQLGIDAPTDGWTWDDFYQIAYELKSAGYVTGMWKVIENIEHIITAHGGSFMSPDGSLFDGYANSLDTERAFEHYFERLDPVIEQWTSHHMSNITLDSWPAMGLARASQLYVFFQDEDRRYDIAPMPTAANGQKVNTTAMTGLAMVEVSENKELAWELMRFIIGDSDAKAMRFVDENTLYANDDRFGKTPPSRLGVLLEGMRKESLQSQPTAFMFSPLGGPFGSHYSFTFNPQSRPKYAPATESPYSFNFVWAEREEGDLRTYLNAVTTALGELRDMMLAHGW